MHAVSTNQIADILHFKDNILYLQEITKILNYKYSKNIY